MLSFYNRCAKFVKIEYGLLHITDEEITLKGYL